MVGHMAIKTIDTDFNSAMRTSCQIHIAPSAAERPGSPAARGRRPPTEQPGDDRTTKCQAVWCSKLFGRKPASLLPPPAHPLRATPLTYRANPSPRDSTTYRDDPTAYHISRPLTSTHSLQRGALIPPITVGLCCRTTRLTCRPGSMTTDRATR